MAEAELLKAFNAGIGMVLSVAAEDADAITTLLTAAGETVSTIGTVTTGEGVSYTGSLL